MEYSDSELIDLILDGVEEAIDILIKKYNKAIYHYAKEINKRYQYIDYEDLHQEGLYSLLSSIYQYKEYKNILFWTYAQKCIKTNILNYIRCYNSKKNEFINNSDSLDKVIFDNKTAYDIIPDERVSVEDIVLDNDNNIALLSRYRNLLTQIEFDVFSLKISGFNNLEISKLLNMNRKNVENTIFRIKGKIKVQLYEK